MTPGACARGLPKNGKRGCSRWVNRQVSEHDICCYCVRKIAARAMWSFRNRPESGKAEVMRTISRMARKFRERAGESLAMIAKHSAPLPKATTPSLDAWKAYSEGSKMGMLGGHTAALPFFRRAIEIDSKFASAYAFLGRDYTAIGEMELARQYTRKAFEYRERANDQERFFIDYSYYRVVTGNLDKALETSELWRHMYPRQALAQTFYGATAKVLGEFPSRDGGGEEDC